MFVDLDEYPSPGQDGALYAVHEDSSMIESRFIALSVLLFPLTWLGVFRVQANDSSAELATAGTDIL